MADQDRGRARLYVLLEPEMKDKLEEIAFKRKRQLGHRVTLTDLVLEALQELIDKEEGKKD